MYDASTTLATSLHCDRIIIIIIAIDRGDREQSLLPTCNPKSGVRARPGPTREYVCAQVQRPLSETLRSTSSSSLLVVVVMNTPPHRHQQQQQLREKEEYEIGARPEVDTENEITTPKTAQPSLRLLPKH